MELKFGIAANIIMYIELTFSWLVNFLFCLIILRFWGFTLQFKFFNLDVSTLQSLQDTLETSTSGVASMLVSVKTVCDLSVLEDVASSSNGFWNRFLLYPSQNFVVYAPMYFVRLQIGRLQLL